MPDQHTPFEDESDPDKSLEELLHHGDGVFMDSSLYLDKNWRQFYDKNPGKFIALRVRYGAEPPYFVEFAESFEGLLDIIQAKYPRTWALFNTERLDPSNWGPRA